LIRLRIEQVASTTIVSGADDRIAGVRRGDHASSTPVSMSANQGRERRIVPHPHPHPHPPRSDRTATSEIA
jgi:hypothetical protein